MGLPWDTLLQDADRRMRSSDIRDLLAVTARPEVISFAGGLPAPELFPVEALRASFDAVFARDGRGALQYGPTEGYAPLREFLVQHLARRGIATTAEEILITTGSQQGLDLLGKVLLKPGAPVMVEAPSYVGALQALSAHEPRYLAVPMDEEGLRVDVAEQQIRETGLQPALLYSVATFQNPSGVTMSERRRRQLIEFCTAHQIPLIEDDPYGELRYSGEVVPPLRALPGGEETVYLGTFSKILAPGLRLAWVVAPKPLLARMVIAKQAADLHTDSLVQRAILHYCQHNDLEEQITRLQSVYRERRDAMISALARTFPAHVRWTEPDGGLFLWVTLPPGANAKALLRDALSENVAFVPGTAFHVDGSGQETLRMSFSHAGPARIEEGVRRLAAVLSAHLPLTMAAV